jgi:hypothetical protein
MINLILAGLKINYGNILLKFNIGKCLINIIYEKNNSTFYNVENSILSKQFWIIGSVT